MSNTSIIAHDSEYINLEQTYEVVIFDKQILTSVTSVREYVDEWISDIESESKGQAYRLIVGLEVKLRPKTAGVALVVLFAYRSCLVYEIAHTMSIPLSLTRFLSDDNITFVGVGLESKLQQLQQEHGVGGDAWHHDLGSLTAARYNKPDLNEAGLGQLRTFLHGGDVQRPEVAGNWDEVKLSIDHVHHATIDAYTCYELGSYLVYPVGKGKRVD